MSRVEAIVYTSNAGHTEQYAKMLAQETGLKAYELSEAKETLDKGTSVIFLGWLMASNIKGYKRAIKSFRVQAVCGVGMTPGQDVLKDIVEKNNIPEGRKAFYLQGGFEWDKVSGIYKSMMKALKKGLGKKLEEKEERTENEDEVLDLLNNGGSRVAAERLVEVTEWVNA